MKKIMIAVALMVGILSVSEVNAQGNHHGYDKQNGRHSQGHGYHQRGPVGNEQVKQHQRIQHGKHTGQLNRAEAHRLHAQQMHIQSLKQLAKADGRITRKERIYIEQQQARASANIHRQKHNCR